MLLAGYLAPAHGAAGSAEPAYQACLAEQLRNAADDATVGELRAACRLEQRRAEESLLLGRLRREQAAERLRSVLTAHRRNYLIPASYVADPNEDPFATAEGVVPAADRLQNVEAKFQLSLKATLARGLLLPQDQLYFGFTTLSFWQAYNTDVSAPFRETNYEPELFWSLPFDWGPLGLDAGVLTLGVSHESNGRGGSLSRSWNRLYADIAFEEEDFVVSLKPWWRIPEDEKDDPLDAGGDDNPDIERYLGNYELTAIYRRGDHEFSLMLRNHLSSDGKGAVRLEWAFPLLRNVRGFAQYFNGHGESLIDYDAEIERIGIGILLTDLL
jgi:phospholipase A1